MVLKGGKLGKGLAIKRLEPLDGRFSISEKPLAFHVGSRIQSRGTGDERAWNIP